MPNEPSALPEILAALPDAADYDAVHAALTATEAGRRFLAEFAARNRNADTTMVVAAIARVEATIRGDGARPAAAARAGELIEIAAALDRVRTAMSAGTASASKLAAASERVQDLAFTLHERALDAQLRDALDAAIAELAAAVASSDRGAVELVHALASRVAEMIGERATAQPAASAEELPPPTKLFAMAANDGEAFAQAVASLAAATAAPAKASAAVSAPPAEAVAAEVPPADESEEPPAAERESGRGAAPTIETADPAGVASDTTPAAADSATAATPAQPVALEVSGSEAILSQAFADDFFTVKEPSAPEPVPAPDSERTDQPSEPAPSEAILPAHDLTAGPEEDPAELFEPQPANPPPSAAAEATADAPAPSATPVGPPQPAEPPQPARVVPPPPPLRAIPRPPLSDPLAAVRDLSDEERIALFS